MNLESAIQSITARNPIAAVDLGSEVRRRQTPEAEQPGRRLARN